MADNYNRQEWEELGSPSSSEEFRKLDHNINEAFKELKMSHKNHMKKN